MYLWRGPPSFNITIREVAKIDGRGLTGVLDCPGTNHEAAMKRKWTVRFRRIPIPIADTSIRRATACFSVCANSLNSFERRSRWHGSCATGFKTEE
jgi:hypothetical protein